MFSLNPFAGTALEALFDSIVPDFVLAFTFFTALCFAVLGRQFGRERPAAAMSIALGAALATGLIWWEQANDVSIHDLGPVAMDINVGYTRRTGDGTNAPTASVLWTVSFGGAIAGSLGWTGECFGYPRTTREIGAQPSIVALLGGPTYLIKKWLAIDAGVILPLTGPQPHALYAGGVYNVGRM